MISKMDTVLDDLEKKEKLLKEQVSAAASEESKQAAAAEEEALRASGASEELVRIDELMSTIRKVCCDSLGRRFVTKFSNPLADQASSGRLSVGPDFQDSRQN